MKDRVASVLDRLRNQAKNLDINYQECLQLFVQEEFLRRLSKSNYADNFILKGGYFIYTLTNFSSRPTVDVDFLLKHQNTSISDVQKIIEEVVSTQTGNDFIEMTAKGFEEISTQRKYNGISAQILAKIKNVRIIFNIDIGIGDVITPYAKTASIQTQLTDFEKPEIWTYSLESVIAEKFDAILKRFELTSRMKDFHDIYYLSQNFNFEGQVLQEAIFETLYNRKTEYCAESLTRICQLIDDESVGKRWKAFTKKTPGIETDFTTVITGIQKFLEPVFIALIDKKQFLLNWTATKIAWE